MYRNNMGNNGGGSHGVQNNHGPSQNSRTQPNSCNQVHGNSHNGNPSQNGRTGGAGAAKPNGGRNGNPRRPS